MTRTPDEVRQVLDRQESGANDCQISREIGSRALVVGMYWKHWPCVFPQHGPGRKHDRPIFLAPWREELVSANQRSLIRGLIHSDGCRVVANDRGVKSVRYHFSNLSEDITHLLHGRIRGPETLIQP